MKLTVSSKPIQADKLNKKVSRACLMKFQELPLRCGKIRVLFVTVLFIWHLGGESRAPDKIFTFVLLNLYFGATNQSQNIHITQLSVKGQIRGL